MMVKDNPRIKTGILEASKDVFKRLGYFQANMEEVARAVGMGRSSLYYYFKNKTEIFEAIALDEFTNVLKISMTNVSRSRKLTANFLQYYQTKISLLKGKTEEYPNILEDLKKQMDIFYKIKEKTTALEIKNIEVLLEWGLDNKEIAPLPPADMQILSNAMVQAFCGLEQDIFLYGKVVDAANKIEWLSGIMVKGLR